jgi:hypothetical protein
MIPDSTLSPSDGGASGWSIGVRGRDVAIVDATLSGTAAADVTDSPPGRHQTGYRMVQLTHGEGNEGVVSAVVLSAVVVAQLPTQRASSILGLTVEATASSDESEIEAALEFHDGLRGSGQPVQNTVWHRGNTRDPVRVAKRILVSGRPKFARGDTNADGRVDVSDSVFVLNYLFIGGREPPCLDAAAAARTGGLRRGYNRRRPRLPRVPLLLGHFRPSNRTKR